MTRRRTCVIADDHMIVRDGIRMRLASDPSVEITGEASDGREALDLITELEPDVALLDLRMPTLDGFEVAMAVRAAELSTRIVIYSGLASPQLLERGFEAGIDGFVGKESHREVLFAAIDLVCRGERFVDPTVAARMIGSERKMLSAREQEVLALMADGLPNPVIAERLGIAPETVRNHVSAVLRKLEASSRTAAVSKAFRTALLM
jgi:DNA-binding NarL/FixJ family response regulator